jgi:hypothetical protein
MPAIAPRLLSQAFYAGGLALLAMTIGSGYMILATASRWWPTNRKVGKEEIGPQRGTGSASEIPGQALTEPAGDADRQPERVASAVSPESQAAAGVAPDPPDNAGALPRTGSPSGASGADAPGPAPPEPARPVLTGAITTLMLSNLGQFTSASTSSGRPAGEIAASLLADLRQQCGIYGLQSPQLVLLPGGVARSAGAAEYEAALSFLRGIQAELSLTPDQILVTPGTGDINASLYGRYRRESQAARLEPAPPYWPKWAPLTEMLGKLYSGARDPLGFGKDRPWGWYEDPGRRTAVAIMNSTMHDTGQFDRSGHLGPDQVRFFASKAAERYAAGWLCIGMMHDSPVPPSEGAIIDAGDFGARVARNLNVIIYGRPRPSRERVSRIGSAVVLAPAENSSGAYQLLSVEPHKDRVLGRVYDVRHDQWNGDMALSNDLRAWWRPLPLRSGT